MPIHRIKSWNEKEKQISHPNQCFLRKLLKYPQSQIITKSVYFPIQTWNYTNLNKTENWLLS